MQVESEIMIDRPSKVVFDYIARAERLPEYVTDFALVEQVSGGDPGRGTQYRYEMKRGQAKGTFEWIEFQPNSRLAWHGPPAKAGPGTMEPSGWWELSDRGESTLVRLVMAPKPGGLFKVMAPLMKASMRKGNARAMKELKDRIEGSDGVLASN